MQAQPRGAPIHTGNGFRTSFQLQLDLRLKPCPLPLCPPPAAHGARRDRRRRTGDAMYMSRRYYHKPRVLQGGKRDLERSGFSEVLPDGRVRVCRKFQHGDCSCLACLPRHPHQTKSGFLNAVQQLCPDYGLVPRPWVNG